MTVKILAFGIAKDIVGGRSSDLVLEDNTTIADVKTALTKSFPAFKDLQKFAIAVNESYQEDDYEIHDGDELVIIPPVSGG